MALLEVAERALLWLADRLGSLGEACSASHVSLERALGAHPPVVSTVRERPYPVVGAHTPGTCPQREGAIRVAAHVANVLHERVVTTHGLVVARPWLGAVHIVDEAITIAREQTTSTSSKM